MQAAAVTSPIPDGTPDGARGVVPFTAAHLRDTYAGKRGGHPIHPAIAWPCQTRHHRHLHRGEHQTTARSSRPLPPLGEARKNASTSAAKSVILGRGSKLSERLSIFSRRSANNGQGVPCLRLCITGLRPKDSRQGLSPSPIGSPFTAEPWPLNVHAGFEGMRLQNCIGSG